MWWRPCRPSVQKAINGHGAGSRQACSPGQEPPSTQIGAHAAARRASRPDGQLGNSHRLDWQLHDRRRAPMRSDAGETCNRRTNQTEDFELYSPSRFGQLGRPVYKPEHWDKVQQLDMWTNKEDPVMTCQPLGSRGRVRPGASSRRRTTSPFSTGRCAMPAADYAEFRVVPTDGRKHDPEALEAKYYWAIRSDTGRATRWCSTPSVRRYDLAGARRFLPLRQDACRGEIHASGRCAFSTTSRSRTLRCWWSRGVPDTHRAAQRESERGPDPGARQLRDGFREGSGGHADSTLADADHVEEVENE